MPLRKFITWNYGWDFIGLSMLICKPHKEHGWAIHFVIGPFGISISNNKYHQWNKSHDS